jgi:hypothetical protein
MSAVTRCSGIFMVTCRIACEAPYQTFTCSMEMAVACWPAALRRPSASAGRLTERPGRLTANESPCMRMPSVSRIRSPKP